MVLGLSTLFKPRPQAASGKALYERAVEQARTPALYLDLRAPDSLEGRFELYTLHVLLLVLRLKSRSNVANETVQATFDAYLQGLDIGLRELGVTDQSISKRMKKLGRAFYGRVANWEKALVGNEPIEPIILRTVYEGVNDVDAAPLADYVRRAITALAEQPDEELLAGQVQWPKVIP